MLKKGILTENKNNKNNRNIINKTYSDYLRKIIFSSNSQALKKKKKFNSHKIYNDLHNKEIGNKIKFTKANFNINDYKPKNRKFAIIRNSSDITKYMPKENSKLNDDNYFSLLNDFEVNFPRGNTCFYLIYNKPNEFIEFNDINSINYQKASKIRFYQFINNKDEVYKHNINKLLLPFCIYNHKSTYYGNFNNFCNEYHIEYIYKNDKNNIKKFTSKKKEEESKNNNYYEENYNRNTITIPNIKNNYENEEIESNEDNKYEGDNEILIKGEKKTIESEEKKNESESFDKLSFGNNDSDNELFKRKELNSHCIVNIIKLPKYRNKKNIFKFRRNNNKIGEKKKINLKNIKQKKIMNLSVDSKLKNNTKSIKENEHSNSNSRKKKIKNIEYLRDIYY